MTIVYCHDCESHWLWQDTFVFRLIENVGKMIEPPLDEIVYCYGEYQSMFSHYPQVDFRKGLPDLDDFDGHVRTSTTLLPLSALHSLVITTTTTGTSGGG